MDGITGVIKSADGVGWPQTRERRQNAENAGLRESKTIRMVLKGDSNRNFLYFSGRKYMKV